jgi:hypothetical protein
MSTNWESGTRALAEELEAQFPNIIDISTYPGHGTAGEEWSIDAWIAPYGRMANDKQENVGDRIQNHVLRHWNRMGIGYVIWWNWARQDHRYWMFSREPAHTWFPYKPYALLWLQNNPGDWDPETYYHFDHFHITRRPGAAYRPPRR